MPQSLAQVWIHAVFSTKERRPFLQDETFREEMFRILAFHVKATGSVNVCVGGHVDHVHLLIGLSRTVTIAGLIEKVKTETSKWAKSHVVGNAAFAWQAGYGAFSVSHSRVDEVEAYIRSQEEHHRRTSFQDEFRKLCERHGLIVDERHAWS